MDLPGNEFPEFKGHFIPFLEELLQNIMTTDRPEGSKGEFLN